MKNQMALSISLAAVLSAAVATVALRAAARRQQARSMPGTEPAPIAVTVGESRPASVVEQTQHVFHELHADGRNALCAVCDSYYRPAGHDRG
jgi:hypothetical protein